MKHKYVYLHFITILVAVTLVLTGCKKQEYALPSPKMGLVNDVLKRTLGPNIVGEQIEFAYAVAIKDGDLEFAEATASIPGANGTFMEHRSFFTNGSGTDVGVTVGSPSSTTHNVTRVNFTVDTSASTLRYYYVVPEEARGKTVSFTFSAKSKDGQTVSIQAGPYQVSKMDMIRNITVKNGDTCYISISDMTVYTKANVAANAAKVDLVYRYSATPSTFAYALISPASDSLLQGVTIPAGLNKSTKVRKTFNLQDYNLARLQFGIYIDDLDFQQLNLTDAQNYALNLKAEAGVWAETADGKYRAYVYINSVNATNRSAVISMKRYAL
jgi:hypothetical protein